MTESVIRKIDNQLGIGSAKHKKGVSLPLSLRSFTRAEKKNVFQQNADKSL